MLQAAGVPLGRKIQGATIRGDGGPKGLVTHSLGYRNEAQDPRGGLRRLPEPWRVPGGQHLQSGVRDQVGHGLGDRNATERVPLAPDHQRGHSHLTQFVRSHA